MLDTYDGTVKLYVVDPDDPIVDRLPEGVPGAVPDQVDDMPLDLLNHWRYPEDLFRLQTNMYGRYHITDPSNFYEKTSAWSVASDPGTSVGGTTHRGPDRHPAAHGSGDAARGGSHRALLPTAPVAG